VATLQPNLDHLDQTDQQMLRTSPRSPRWNQEAKNFAPQFRARGNLTAAAAEPRSLSNQ